MHADELNLVFLTQNLSDGIGDFPVSVDLRVSLEGTGASSRLLVLQNECPSVRKRICDQLVVGGDAKADLKIAIDSAFMDDLVRGSKYLPVVVNYSVETMLGTETTEKRVDLLVPITITLKERFMSEDDFVDMMESANSSSGKSEWSSSRVVIDNITGSSKATLKCLGNLLHGHCVMHDKGRSASYCAISGHGVVVVILAKMNSINSLSVDIKCQTSGRMEKQSLADCIATAIKTAYL